jgi:hypothetical protein
MVILLEQKRAEGVLATPPSALTTTRLERDMADEDITGRRFGRLVAIRRSATGNGRSWVIQCDCGNEFETQRSNLVGRRSCGFNCPVRREHNAPPWVEEPLHWVWNSMKARVHNPKHKSYPRYGGRGIRVCPEWQKYKPFREWALANGYARGLSIERIDNEGDYRPENCRWATMKEQSRNKSSNLLVKYRGKTTSLVAHAEAAGIPYPVVQQRFTHLRWSIDRALETPVGKRSKGAKA